jgi:NAD(P)-dependent dehydrogenase (short-subunit alcohol dehydrogenase family)
VFCTVLHPEQSRQFETHFRGIVDLKKERAMTNKLAGKVAVITGASAGIGLAAAKRFIREGMDRVFITGRRENALDAAVAEIGEKATGIPGDVASLTDVDRLYEAASRFSYWGNFLCL